jgi:hypothetical protein
MGKKLRIPTPDGTVSFHRPEVCQRALAPAFQDLCEQAQAAGWERREAAYALMVLAASELRQATTDVETVSEVAEVIPSESGGPGYGSEESA